MSRRLQERLFPAAYLLAILWLNLYICRQVFFLEFTGKMNSMHGFWMAMARLAGEHWYKPSWWPYWYIGMPFEFTYAPLVPGLTAAIAKSSGVSVAQAFQIVSGIVYCLGPVALFLMARQLTERPGWSFVAAAVYSLSSASELLLPDSNFKLSHVGDPRRLYLCFVWDEVPHQLGLALVCLAILFLARGLRYRRFGSFVWAGVFISLALLASAFGVTGLLLLGACLLVTWETGTWRRNFVAVFLCGFLAYLAMCPFLPPSLILAIRADAGLFPDTEWTRASLWTLAAVVSVGSLLWFVSRKWQPRYLQFFFLLAYLCVVIPTLDKMRGLHFVPQAGRYKVELELALVLLAVFGSAVAIDRLPKMAKLVLALLLLWPAYKQVVWHRHFSKDVMKPFDITTTIEYQVAKWLESNRPGWRVVAPGSIGQWLNAFSNVPQFAGGSYSTDPNLVHLVALSGVPAFSDAVIPAIWYKAYGVDTVVVAGRDSPEFWQPHPHGHQFDGVFPVLWEERDTRIYAVPRPARTLAHAIPQDAVISRVPAEASDTAQIEKYVAAVEAAGAHPATFVWMDDSRARIHATLGASQVLSVQVTHHPGWKATAGGNAVRIAKDGLGQMILSVDRPGDYDIDLAYDGGWEGKLCRLVSATTCLAVALALYYRRRTAAAR